MILRARITKLSEDLTAKTGARYRNFKMEPGGWGNCYDPDLFADLQRSQDFGRQLNLDLVASGERTDGQPYQEVVGVQWKNTDPWKRPRIDREALEEVG